MAEDFGPEGLLDPETTAVVLVVDDDEVLRALLQAALSRWGCSVDVAADGVDALRCLSQRAYDVILTDIQMPMMDGVSLWRHAVDAGHPGAWILMTGSTAPRLECMIPILHKPLRLHELHNLLKREQLSPASTRTESIAPSFEE